MNYLDEYGRIIWIGYFWGGHEMQYRTIWYRRLATVTSNYTKFWWYGDEDYELAKQELTYSTRLEF